MGATYSLDSLLTAAKSWTARLAFEPREVLAEMAQDLGGILNAIRFLAEPTEANRGDSFETLGILGSSLSSTLWDVPLSREVIWGLYQARCEQQRRYGRPLHKGRDLYNLGYLLYRNGQHDQGVRLVSLALVEDTYHWGNADAVRASRAYEFLQSWVYGQQLAEEIFSILQRRIAEFRGKQHMWYPEQVFDLSGAGNVEVFPALGKGTEGLSRHTCQWLLKRVKARNKGGKPLEQLSKVS